MHINIEHDLGQHIRFENNNNLCVKEVFHSRYVIEALICERSRVTMKFLRYCARYAAAK